MQEMQVRSLGWEDPLEKEMAILSSIPAWEIPWTEEVGGLQYMGLQKSRIQLSNQIITKPENQVWARDLYTVVKDMTVEASRFSTNI